MARDDQKKKFAEQRAEQTTKTIGGSTIGDDAVIDKLPEIDQIHQIDLFSTPKQD